MVTIFVMLPALPLFADILGDLTVKVIEQTTGKPLQGVRVSLQDTGGRQLPWIQTTDDSGIARFNGLRIGSYVMQTEKQGFVPESGSVIIKENASGELTLALAESGREAVVKVSAKRLLMNAKDTNSSSNYKNREFMQERMANDGSLQQVANLSPGVTLDAQGLLHFRGEHRSMSMAVDGVVLPIPLQSQIGSLVDPRFLEELEVRTGSYDPSFGGQLGGVLNLVTRGGGRKPEGSFESEAGDWGTYGTLLSGGGSADDERFRYFFGASTHHTDLRLEAPNPVQQQLNNQGDDTNALAHLTFGDRAGQVGLTLATQNLRTNLPNTPIAQAANVRQWQRENNIFGVLSWRRDLSPTTQVLLGVSWMGSHQSVGNNGAFTRWQAADSITTPHAFAEQLPANPEDPGNPFLPSLSRTGFQKLFTIQVTERLPGSNTLRIGGAANFIRLSDFLDITDAGGSRLLPNGVPHYVAVDNRNGFDGGLFAGDTLNLTDKLAANIGARLDRYNNGLNVSTMQVSPLFNFSYAISPTQALRWSIDRLFTAPPLEPDPTGSTHVIPQKTSMYELEYEWQANRDLVISVDGYEKNYTDPLDLALLVPLSNLPVFVPVNFPKGQTVGSELSIHTERAAGFNWFFNFSGTSMHILAPSPGTETIPLVDHFENILSTFGLSYKWKNAMYASVDNKYGSGFPQDAIVAYNADGIYPFGIRGRQSRFIINVNIGYLPNDKVGGSLQVFNLFNNDRVLTLLSNFSGTRFVKERTVLFNLHIPF